MRSATPSATGAEMEQVLTGEQAHHVVAAEHPDPETPVEETKTATQE